MRHPTHPAGRHLWLPEDDEAVRRLCEAQAPVRVDHGNGRWLTGMVALALMVTGLLVGIAAPAWSVLMVAAVVVELAGVALLARLIRVCAR